MPKTSTKPSAKIILRELSEKEIPSIFPLIHLHNATITKPIFTKRLKEMLPLGYRAVGAFDGDKLVGVSGFWIRTRFWCGKQFDIDNFFVDPSYRNRRIGQRLMTWLDKKAVAEGCQLTVLDVYTHNHKAHRFYYREGYIALGYHFTKIPGTREPYNAIR